MYALTCALKGRPAAATWDLVSGLLYQFHSQGIEEGEEPAPVGDAALVAANEFELALEPGILQPPERFSAYFDNLRDAEHAQRAVEPVLATLDPVFDIHEVEQKDYAELWKENFHPIRVPPFWLVRAPWHDVDAGNAREIIIEPGMAFGTGSHETTRACLQLLAEAMNSSKSSPIRRVLDFGCGSGILAIALRLLGAKDVYAVDIDPLAMQATAQNAELNRVKVTATMEPGRFKDLGLIVANILKNTLLEHAEAFHGWLKPGGFLILSGLLEAQEAEVAGRYASLGFSPKTRLCQNGWVSLLLENGRSNVGPRVLASKLGR